VIGRTISHYQVLERLGGGGMGLVYRARDTRLERDVALKFLPREWSHEPQLRERFSREARAASALDHPHICTVYDVGETEEGQLYIAMAYCPGRTLKQLILEGPLPVERALGYAIQIAGALERAHEAAIVHRDIKPANILVNDHDEIKIVDFGLAKLAGDAAVTREGSVIGTPAYMSPEQVNGDDVDGRSDLWAVGAVLYEMLTGRRAFPADHEQAVLLSILESDPTPVDTVRPAVPAELARIVRRCLKRDLGQRYQSAGELLADLRRARGESSPTELVTQTLPTAPHVRRRWLLRHRLLPAAAAVAAVVVAASLYPTFDRQQVRHVLVLPFDCQSADDETAALCGGLLEVVTNRLTALRQYQDTISVVPASEVRSQRVQSADEAHRTFGVDLVLTGGVQRQGADLRVSLQLVDAARLRQIGSRLVTAAGESDFVIQDHVAAVVEELLDIELTAIQRRAMTAGGTASAEAAHKLLEARGAVGPNPTPSELGRAAELFRSALDIDPFYADAVVGLVEVCLRRYEVEHDPIWLEHGLSYAERAIELQPSLPAAHLAAGRCEQGLRAHAEAAARFERTIELDPLDLEAHLELAASYEDAGEPGRAEAAVDRALRTGPEDWLTHYRIGRFFYFERHDPRRAVPYFEKVVELIPDSSVGFSALGGCQLELGQIAAARGNLERAAAIGSRYDAFANLATLEFYEGRYGRAAELYRRALELDDADYLVWNSLGEALRFAGDDPGGAREAYRRAAELAQARLDRDPDDQALLIDLASFQARLGQEAAARALLARALDRPLEDPNLMFAAAAALEDLGDREQALRWVRSCLEAGYPAFVIEGYAGLRALTAAPEYNALKAAVGATASQTGAIQEGGAP
jgi:serine/threonine-protein kinase